MSSVTELKVDWCSHEAAEYAVTHWHYSRRMPKSKLAKIGAWEREKFIGGIIYGVGATSSLVKSYGLLPEQGCELVRVALRRHETPVSRLIAISLRMLRKAYSGLRLVVSFADPEQGHVGGIYQAGGWLFTGLSAASDEYIYKGQRWQGRSFRHNYKGMEHHPDVRIVKGSPKYRYVMPLDSETRARVAKLAKPYPKRVTSDTIDTAAVHADEGGETPTVTLQPARFMTTERQPPAGLD
jgi:hypothetical protein